MTDPLEPRTRLLLVEDDDSARHAMIMLFEHAGFDVRAATGVREATDLLAAWRPRAVLLDLMLPDGEGTDILRFIRRRRIDVDVIVATGAGDYDLLRRARALHPDLFLVKPFEVLDVLAWLRGRADTPRAGVSRT